MVKEYVRKFTLYTPEYHEHQKKLLAQYSDKKASIEEYLREVKDVILDDIRDAVADKRASINACLTVNTLKTPGMTVRKAKRKLQTKKVPMIPLDSPETSFVEQLDLTENAAKLTRFASCTGESSANTPTNTMTPNRSDTNFRQTRLGSILNRHQSSIICTTPTSTSTVKSTRSARAKTKLLEQSLVNSTLKKIQFEAHPETPNKSSTTIETLTPRETMTPRKTVTPNLKSTELDRTDDSNVATPMGSTPVTPTDYPANSTMFQPGTPAAAFDSNITLIKSTPNESKNGSIVVSSPIGPISTTGTPTANSSTAQEKTENDWIVSTGKRRSQKAEDISKREEKCSASPLIKRVQLSPHQSSPVPTPTPVEKRLQLSPHQPSPVPTPTPVDTRLQLSSPHQPSPVPTAVDKRLQLSSPHQPSPVPTAAPVEKQPALLSLTTAGTPTPEDPVRTIFTSPTERCSADSADLTRTPNLKDFKSPGALLRNSGLRINRNLGRISETEISIDEPEISCSIETLPETVQTKNTTLEKTEIPETNVLMEIEDEIVVTEMAAVMESNEECEDSEVGNDEDVKDMSIDAIENEGNVSMASLNESSEANSIEADKENVCPPTPATILEVKVESAPAKLGSEESTLAKLGSEEKFFMEPEQLTPNEMEPSSSDAACVGDGTGNVDGTRNVAEATCTKKVGDGTENVAEATCTKKVGDGTENVAEATCTENDGAVTENIVVDEPVNASNDLFESCESDNEEIKEIPVETPELENKMEDVAEETEEKELVCEVSPKMPSGEGSLPTSAKEEKVPVRATRSSRNKKVSEKLPVKLNYDLGKIIDVPGRNTRSSKKVIETKDQPLDGSKKKQGTVKKIAEFYERTSKDATSKIPCPIKKNLREDLAESGHDSSKREREDESDSDCPNETEFGLADESFQMKKKQKDNTGIPRNPPNLMTGVFSMVDKPATVVKSAKELEEEKIDAARKKIEEKDAKAQQVLNKKKQRENELRVKRIEREKKMRQAKQNKEDEVKKNKAELVERMRKKEETSLKEREILAKKEDEKRQKEIKKQEQAERRRKQAEKARELNKKKLQEEAEEKKADAFKRKQELEAQKVKELEKHRLDEEARLEEQRKAEAEEKEKKQKAEEERRRHEAEAEKKKATPTRHVSPARKAMLTGNVGTLLNEAPVRPARINKQASKIPTKQRDDEVKSKVEPGKAKDNKVRVKNDGKEDVGNSARAISVQVKEAGDKSNTVEEASVEDGVVELNAVEVASNCGGKDETFSREVSKSKEDDEKGTTTANKSILSTPLVEAELESSPYSAAATKSYMKTKLLSLGKSKSNRSKPIKLDAISESNTVKRSAPSYDPRDNYKIDDMESGDDTDDEKKPKRTIPLWARNKVGLAASLKKQFTCPNRPAVKTIFGAFPQTADLDTLFGTVNRYTSRTSSAHWAAPPSTGNLDFSILTEAEITHANEIMFKYTR